MDNKKFLNPEKPIFIVGCPRSGTTVLAVQLGRHPEIVTTPETAFFELITHFWPFALQKQPVSDKILDQLFKIPRLRKLNLDILKLKKILAETDRSHRSLFCAIMEYYRKENKKPIWCEKTPRHLYHVKKIYEFFPDAKIIHIVRDGRDVANSLRKVEWREGILATQAHEWAKNAKIGWQLNKTLPSERFLTIYYEDLLADTNTTLINICRFIGVNYSLFLDNANNKREESEDPCVLNWTGYEKDMSTWIKKTKDKLDTSRISAWKGDFSEKEVDITNYIMGNWLKQWGYDHTDVSLNFRKKIILELHSRATWLLRLILDVLAKYAPRLRTKKYLKFLSF